MSLAVPQQQQVMEASKIGLSRLGQQWDVRHFFWFIMRLCLNLIDLRFVWACCGMKIL